MSAVDDESLFEQLFHDVFSGHLQVHRQHQTSSTNFLNDRKASKLIKSSFEVLARLADVSQQVVLVDNFEIFEACPAGQRTSAERCSMLARIDRRRDILF